MAYLIAMMKRPCFTGSRMLGDASAQRPEAVVKLLQVQGLATRLADEGLRNKPGCTGPIVGVLSLRGADHAHFSGVTEPRRRDNSNNNPPAWMLRVERNKDMATLCGQDGIQRKVFRGVAGNRPTEHKVGQLGTRVGVRSLHRVLVAPSKTVVGVRSCRLGWAWAQLPHAQQGDQRSMRR